MNTKVIKNIDALIEITPVKRTTASNLIQPSSNISPNKRRTAINEKYSKFLIQIQDTPSPFVSRYNSNKDSSLSDLDKTETSFQTNSKENVVVKTKARKIIPNTPCFFNSQTTSKLNHKETEQKKDKKLRNLLAIDERDLHEESSTSFSDINKDLYINKRKNKNENNQNQQISKPSQLFKPKLNINDDDSYGCDLSFESLERRERSRRKEVVSINEALAMEKKKQEKLMKKKPEETEFVEPEPVKAPAPKTKSSINIRKISDRNGSNSKSDLSSSPTSFNTSDDTFTKVTRQFDSNCDLNDKTLDENELDEILFDGLEVNKNKFDFNKFIALKKSPEQESIRTQFKKTSRLHDKTNILKKNQNKINTNVNDKSEEIPAHGTRIKKNFKLSYFNLSSKQVVNMKEIVKSLTNCPYYPNKKFSIVPTFQEDYSINTTHLIIDFINTFHEPIENSLNLKKRTQLLLATINNCKIVRYEWLKESKRNNLWLDENRYLLNSDIGSDLNEYDENDYDIKLVKLYRQLIKGLLNTEIFCSFKNIFVMEEEIQQEGDESFFGPGNTTLNGSSFLVNRNYIQSYLTEILVKFGGHVTSRVTCAEVIIAIDKTRDYNLKNESHLSQIERDKAYFEMCIDEYKGMIRKKRRLDGVPVISSDWIIDSVLANQKLNMYDYEIQCIFSDEN